MVCICSTSHLLCVNSRRNDVNENESFAHSLHCIPSLGFFVIFTSPLFSGCDIKRRDFLCLILHPHSQFKRQRKEEERKSFSFFRSRDALCLSSSLFYILSLHPPPFSCCISFLLGDISLDTRKGKKEEHT